MMLLDTLKASNPRLKCLNLNNFSGVNDECLILIGELMNANVFVEDVMLGNTNISDAAISRFALYVNGNTSLRHLYLHNNKGITDKCVPILTKMIESSHIEELNIQNTSITSKGILVVPLARNAIRFGSDKLNLSRL